MAYRSQRILHIGAEINEPANTSCISNFLLSLLQAAYRKATESVYPQFKDIIGADLYDAVLKEAGHG